jgi:hypothetical protein
MSDNRFDNGMIIYDSRQLNKANSYTYCSVYHYSSVQGAHEPGFPQSTLTYAVHTRYMEIPTLTMLATY